MVVTESTGVLYADEALTDALFDELLPLLETHQAEVGHYQDIPLNINKETYFRIASAGMLAIFVARECGKIIGYSIYFVCPSMHYHPYVFANSDALYVDPKYRCASVGRTLIKFAQNELAKHGVSVVFQHGKHNPAHNIGALFRRLGYEHLDDVWSIRLDKG